MKQTKDEKIIAALLSTPTIREAAKAAGVGERTIYSRLNDSEFNAKYAEARLGLLKGHTAALQGHLGKAIEVMAAIMNDTETPPQTRLNAAESIVRNTLKLTEQTDILDRIKALEDAEGVRN